MEVEYIKNRVSDFRDLMYIVCNVKMSANNRVAGKDALRNIILELYRNLNKELYEDSKHADEDEELEQEIRSLENYMDELDEMLSTLEK